MTHWIQTYRGRAVELTAPQPTDIDPVELSILLARLHRFGGHTLVPYTVAEHSLRVAQCLEHDGFPRESILAGLLHDAHEGYLGCDISTPLKNLIDSSVLSAVTTAWDAAVGRRFGIDFRSFYGGEVVLADRLLLATERRDLMRPCDREWDCPLPPPLSGRIDPLDRPGVEFASLLAELTGERVDLREVESATHQSLSVQPPVRTPQRGLAGAACGAPELQRREQ